MVVSRHCCRTKRALFTNSHLAIAATKGHGRPMLEEWQACDWQLAWVFSLQSRHSVSVGAGGVWQGLVGWLASGLLADWFVGRLVGWLVDLFVDVCWLVGWLVGLLG